MIPERCFLEPDTDQMPLNMQPFQIDDEPPFEEEARKNLFKMKNNKTPGASGITVENIKLWYKMARPIK